MAEKEKTSNGLSVVLKALIEEKLQEIKAAEVESLKLEVELNEKKMQYELWKVKIESKKRQQNYLAESIKRLKTEDKSLQYELSLWKADLSPKCKEMAYEEKLEEEHCAKVKAIWTNFEDEWESTPLAIERKKAYSRLLLAEFNLSFSQNKLAYRKKINKIQAEIDKRRLQVAIVKSVEAHLKRQQMERQLQKILEHNEKLNSKLLLLKAENERRSVIPDYFLMPPPSADFHKKSKDYSDTVSIFTMWDPASDLNANDNESDIEYYDSHDMPLSSNTSQQNFKETPMEDCMENESSQKTDTMVNHTNLDEWKSQKTNDATNTYENEQIEMEDCTSTVNDNGETSFLELPQRLKLWNNNMNKSINKNSELSMNSMDFCACSSSNITDFEVKPNSCDDDEKSHFNLSQNDSLQLLKNVDDTSAKVSFTNEKPRNVPIIKSIEEVKTNFQFDPEYNANSISNLFSAHFTPQIESRKNQERNDSQNKLADMEVEDDLSKMDGPPCSPISAMETDFDCATSMTSDMTFFKTFGNVSPPSARIGRLKKPENTVDQSKGEEKKKEPKSSLYGNIQQSNFIGQTDVANFFAMGNDNKKKSLF